MTTAQIAKIMALVDEYLYAPLKQKRAAIEAALRDAPQAEPTEAQIDAYCEAWGAAFEAEEPEAFGVTVEPLSASLRRCIVAGLRAAISAPTAVEPICDGCGKTIPEHDRLLRCNPPATKEQAP